MPKMMTKPADGTLWCERCDAKMPQADEGRLVECGGGYRDLNKHGWGIVSFALCNDCIHEFVAELTEDPSHA